MRGFLLRVVPHTLVAPLRRSGGVRGGVVDWAVILVRVGVSALLLWAEWQGRLVDKWWVAAACYVGSSFAHDPGRQNTCLKTDVATSSVVNDQTETQNRGLPSLNT